jgi:hypothetical protein
LSSLLPPMMRQRGFLDGFEIGNRTQRLAAMAERRNTDLFEVLIGELIDFEVDCLRLQVEASPQNVDLSVDYDEAFDMKALAKLARAEAAVPQEIWDQCIAKMASD